MKRFVLLFLFTLFSYGLSQAATCLDSGCHSDKQDYEYLHGPAAAGECAVCHKAEKDNLQIHSENPEKFLDFTFPLKDKQVCFMCHSDQINGDYVHFPVMEGDCLSCHDPHGGNNRYFISGANESETCMQCHDNSIMAKDYVHGPVAVGECASCHDPHSSNYAHQLKKSVEDLCYDCHTDKKNDFNKEVVHAALSEGCTTCHDPHSSNSVAHINFDSEKELCFSCHEALNSELVTTIKNSDFKHEPVYDGECGACHDPHASDFGTLLRGNAQDVCFTCHVDMREKIENAMYIHGPIITGGCSACHNVHGSNNPFILYEFFPEAFYNDYKESKYQLCFQCHDSQMVAEERTETDTGFRNGNQNLHYLHVRVESKGRSCKACHDVHASNQPNHVRKSVPYGSGGWELPIQFTKTEEGGSCVVGCHKPKSYKR